MNENNEDIDFLLKDFVLSDDVLLKVSSNLFQEFEKGLDKEKHSTANIKMFPTFVRDVPNGTEEGTYLALDLGGSKFRILSIQLSGKLFYMMSRIYEISQAIKVGTGEELFDHIAACLEEYLEQFGFQKKGLPLGFTFSFPCIQRGLTSAILVSWTKGFTCSGVVGQDIVQLLRAALRRRGSIEVDIIAVLNDTTGTLMSCAHVNQNCRVGLIIGTGTNACYMEKLDNVGTWEEDQEEPNQVIINTEWGAFGDNGCLDFVRTIIDHEIDETSLNKGKQLFEKMISGMYMGEIVRRIVSKLRVKGIIFNGKVSKTFDIPYVFKSKYLSYVEDPNDRDKLKYVLQKMDLAEASEEDCEILKRVCRCVSTRSAHLVSAGVATILNKMKRSHTVVGVDGSVYRYHPHIKTLMEKKIKQLTNPNYKFDLMLSEDGSGRGAALVCAVAKRTTDAE